MITFYVKAGAGFPGLRHIEEALVKAVKVATNVVPLRSNTVNPLTGYNSEDNVGRYTPIIMWGIEPVSDILKMFVVPRDGGSEYVSLLKMVPSGEGVGEIKEMVPEAVLD